MDGTLQPPLLNDARKGLIESHFILAVLRLYTSDSSVHSTSRNHQRAPTKLKSGHFGARISLTRRFRHMVMMTIVLYGSWSKLHNC